jgi:hypothetical protein
VTVVDLLVTASGALVVVSAVTVVHSILFWPWWRRLEARKLRELAYPDSIAKTLGLLLRPSVVVLAASAAVRLLLLVIDG